MNLLTTTTVYEAGYTVFPSTAELEIPFIGIVLWIVFLSLAGLAIFYMIFNSICNKIKENRIKERENAMLQLVISQAQLRSELTLADKD